MKKKNKPLSSFILAPLCASLLAACSGQPNVAHPSPMAELNPGVLSDMSQPYRIGVGDEIEVRFFFTPELNDRLQVGPDGKVSIMFAQDMVAAGKTPSQLAADIRQAMRDHVKQPDLVVVMRSFGSQKVFVGGEVSKPGPVILQARENLIQVLDEAGWMTPNAKRDEIVIVRRDHTGTQSIYTVDSNIILSGTDLSQNVMLQPGDIVLVPPSDIVATDRWIDQNIRQVIPFNTGLYYDLSNVSVLH